MHKVNRNLALPMPVVLVGTMVQGKANFMAVGWVSRVNFQPPMLAVGIYNKHFTNEGMRENKAFSVCLPGADLLEKADYCGLVSGRDHDKTPLFTVVPGPETGMPLISECSVNIECKMVQTIELPTNNLYIGEIVGAYAEERFLTNGIPDIAKYGPLFLSMPDNHYWNLGDCAGKAWSVGNALKKEQTGPE